MRYRNNWHFSTETHYEIYFFLLNVYIFWHAADQHIDKLWYNCHNYIIVTSQGVRIKQEVLSGTRTVSLGTACL